MYKLGRLDGETWVEHVHAKTFEIQDNRLIAGLPFGDPMVFQKLLLCLRPPYGLLYVLHTPRGEGEPGRYQSPWIEQADIEQLLTRFGPYLASDARFDLWAYSPADEQTIVWDRHNRLFAYGPIERYTPILTNLGYSEGPVEVPSPHEHHYRPDNDAKAAELLQTLEWSYSALHPEDEQ